jgi:trehalose 6-phosphate synthase/phosphatase
MKNRILIVSNRLPVQLSEKDGQIFILPSAGGLVSSIKSYLRKKCEQKIPGEDRFPVWIGSLDITEKKFISKHLSDRLKDDDFGMSPVFLPAATQDKFYNGFCNDTIWPLFHYFPSYARFKDDYYEHYVLANQRFCDKVIGEYQAGDIIWIHDYHLMLLPSMLRKQLPDAIIGFFLHIPFPSFELFRMLPGSWRKGILQGLLGADLIGFHTYSYAQYFLNSVKQLLGYETSIRTVTTPDRCVALDVFPVSIDYAKFHSVIGNREIFEERNRIKKKLGNVQLIISVDRLDYTKGIINRLEGFALFLKEHPQYIERVSYFLVVVPSRDIITKYKENKETIEGLVSSINGRFGNFEWTPVIYQYKSIDFKKMSALYLAADVALITPIRDGMNLVAKEFVASRSDKRGVLVLSETAGAAAELGEAVIINPTDRKEVADALLQSLTMPVQEQMNRNEFMQTRLKNYDVVKWAEEFISQLQNAHQQQDSMNIKLLMPQTEELIVTHFKTAKRNLFLLDYDGTLSPIARFPHLAAPQPEIINLLKSLSSDKKNDIVIISGRPKKVLDEWFSGIRVNLVAEHGAFYKHAGYGWELATSANMDWKEVAEGVINKFTERCPGSFVEEKHISLAWHYRNADAELGFIRSRELHDNLSALAAHLDFQVIEGKKVIEARPRGIDKGTASLNWLTKNEYDFIFAAGDDRTDEDMFRMLPPEAYSIRVGLMQSAARFNVNQQKDIIALLAKIVSPSQEKSVEPKILSR